MAIHQQTAAANIRNHSRCIIAGALAATAMLELEGERNAWAQAAQCQPTTIKPFEGDASALKGYSGEVRLMIDACERGRVVVRSEQNPNGQSIVPQFAPGPSGYRSGLTLNTCRVGEEDRPGARLDLAYRVGPESRPAGGASFTLAPDEEPPRITEVTPLSGTKVRPGQRMTIKVTASEAYADGNQGWQGGVKSIRVQDLTSHSDLPPWTNDNPRQQPCGAKTWTKTHEMAFRVPDPSPGFVVRLRVVVRDYANNESTQDIEYPTKGDWYGTFRMVSFTVGHDLFRAWADFVLDHDGRGNLTGTMAGQHERVASSAGNCSFKTVQPNRFRAALVGAYTEGRAFKVFIKEVEETKLKWEARCTAVTQYEQSFKRDVWPPEVLLGTPGPLGEGEVLADGTREYKVTHGAGGAGTRWTATLKPARN